MENYSLPNVPPNAVRISHNTLIIVVLYYKCYIYLSVSDTHTHAHSNTHVVFQGRCGARISRVAFANQY